MSFQAMSWAVNQSCPTPTSKLILLLLANYADEHSSCFPSRETLAKLSNCDERTVRRALKQLTEAGLVTIEPRYRETGIQTSNRYFLNLEQSGEAQPSLGGQICTPRVTNLQGGGGQICTPNLSLDTKDINNNAPKDKKSKRKGYCDEFEDWWRAYPRRDGSKAKAYESWSKVISRIDAATLLEQTIMYARSRHGQDSRFTPHATTWLNQDRWETVESVATKPRNRNQLAG
jgi:DNA-binding transcriptional ArsR family regulator